MDFEELCVVMNKKDTEILKSGWNRQRMGLGTDYLKDGEGRRIRKILRSVVYSDLTRGVDFE